MSTLEAATPPKSEKPTSPVAASNRPSMREMTKSLVLKGYLRKTDSGDRYEGMCLNLNLAVEGHSMAEIEGKMVGLIHAYLEDAYESGTWDDMVPRRAPFSYYLEYYRLIFGATFFSLMDFKLFVQSVPCPAHA